MAGFDPMESITQGAQFANGMMEQARQTRAYNALAQQYGPSAGDPALAAKLQENAQAQQMDPLAVQGEQQNVDKGQLALQQQQLEVRQAHVLAAAQALKQAVSQGQPIGAAYDSVVAPNAQLLGMDEAETATMRQHFVDNPGSLDAVIQGLAGPPKPVGGPLMYRNPDGSIGYTQPNERGGATPVPLPSDATAVAPMVGAPQVERLPDGSYGYAMHDKAGNMTVVRADGTPVQGMNAEANTTRADATATNANTGIYRANTTAANSAYGNPAGVLAPAGGPPAPSGPMSVTQSILYQENRGNQSQPTSVNGAVGQGQLTPSFIKTFARPGENPANPADNLAIAKRGIAYYESQYHDPARVAVAYFSGPQNVAPPGSPTPWKHNAKDGNGTYTSDYVADVTGRMIGAGAPGAAAPASGNQPLFNTLPTKGRQMAVSAAQGIVNGSQQLASVDQQIDNIEKMTGPFSVGLGSLTGAIPGTPAANMHAALTTLRSQGLTSWLQSLKNASGTTGIGRVLQSEATAAMNSFGALEQSQSEDQFRYHLGIFKTRVHQLQSNAEQAFQAQYGVDAFSALGVKQNAAPAPGTSAPSSTAALRSKYGL